MSPRKRLEFRSNAETAPVLEELARAGYVRVSRKFGYVSRIDRPDWEKWCEGNGSPIDPDYYRRCLSLDVLELPPDLALQIPTHTERPHYRPPGIYGRDRQPPFEVPPNARDAHLREARVERAFESIRTAATEITNPHKTPDLKAARRQANTILRALEVIRKANAEPEVD